MKNSDALEVLQIVGMILLVSFAAGGFVYVLAQKLAFLNQILG